MEQSSNTPDSSKSILKEIVGFQRCQEIKQSISQLVDRRKQSTKRYRWELQPSTPWAIRLGLGWRHETLVSTLLFYLLAIIFVLPFSFVGSFFWGDTGILYVSLVGFIIWVAVNCIIYSCTNKGKRNESE